MVRRIIGNRINTTHKLAKELLSRPDEFLTVTVGEKEYAIGYIKLVKTHGNADDSILHRTLVCEELTGNSVR